jgi:hypothetical protein
MNGLRPNDQDGGAMRRSLNGFIGGYLIDSGALQIEDLDRGLIRQVELALEGRPVRIGTVLMELGLITQPQLDQALQIQAQTQRPH